jgi:hypothetical protein
VILTTKELVTQAARDEAFARVHAFVGLQFHKSEITLSIDFSTFFSSLFLLVFSSKCLFFLLVSSFPYRISPVNLFFASSRLSLSLSLSLSLLSFFLSCLSFSLVFLSLLVNCSQATLVNRHSRMLTYSVPAGVGRRALGLRRARAVHGAPRARQLRHLPTHARAGFQLLRDLGIPEPMSSMCVSVCVREFRKRGR